MDRASWARDGLGMRVHEANEMSFSPHFCRGHTPRAFVFNAPGEKELRQGKPVAGDTGTNLESALSLLRRAQPTLFPLRIGTIIDSPMPGQSRSPLRSVTGYQRRATHRYETQAMSGAFFMNSRAATSSS